MASPASTAAAATPIRLGVVSFVNTLPLIDGLEGLADVTLDRSVPSRLVDRLLDDVVDVALCSSIDYQRAREPLTILPAGVLGCDGPTLTVRLYATRPIESLERVCCDTDSHTSVVLLQIIFRELYGRAPELLDYDAPASARIVRRPSPGGLDRGPLEWPEAMLLIGDKVVTDSPPAVRYPHQLDLGAAWKELTGLPFVFATWLAKRDADEDLLRTAFAVLDRQRRRNRDLIANMIHRCAVPRGWPADLARSYLGKKLVYEFTDRSLVALDAFFDKAAEHGLIDERRSTRVWGRA